jgi:hypothetical protein
MKPLFRPTARQWNVLITIGFVAVGFALYLRYTAIEQSAVGLACAAGLKTWLCATRRLAVMLFENTVFGWAALAVAALQVIHPSIVLFALGLVTAGPGVVLYNAGLAGLAAGLLIVSFARPVHETI